LHFPFLYSLNFAALTMSSLKTIILVLLAAVSSLTAQTRIKNVDAYTFSRMMLMDSAIVIDLRTPAEIAAKGKIRGALELDYLSKNAEKNIDTLDRNRRYLVYCAGGGRSSECAAYMEQKGFKEIINLDKGFTEWLKNGYDVEKK
jgi:rhodanese-related sulfurtransferase